jgi:hypothetical protein
VCLESCLVRFLELVRAALCHGGGSGQSRRRGNRNDVKQVRGPVTFVLRGRGGKVGRRVSLTGNGRDKRYDRRGVPGPARRRELGLSHGVCIHAEGSLGRTNLYWVIAKGAKSDVGGGVRGRRLTLSKGAYMHTHAEGTLGGMHLYWALGLTTIRTNNTHLDVATRARHLIYLAFVYTIHETTACGQLRPCPQWRSPIPTHMVWT